MGAAISRLPNRFPVGTRYVIEGRQGRICLRYLEFPGGRRVGLPADPAARTGSRPGAAKRGAGRSRARKK
jgi:hypothetical protein